MRIYLVGYMASGKSGTGKELAKLLDYPFLDTDALVAHKAGKTVSAIFSENGESYFRKLENEVLLETSQLPDAVVATGGGLPCHFGQMEWMNENGITVYLQATPAALSSRLLHSRNDRPLLAQVPDEQLTDKIRQQLEDREPYYLKATLKVEALNLRAKELQALLAGMS